MRFKDAAQETVVGKAMLSVFPPAVESVHLGGLVVKSAAQMIDSSIKTRLKTPYRRPMKG